MPPARRLGGRHAPEEAAQWLGMAIEAVVENYGEYVDYNSITTQSDRGDMLYTLLDFLRLAGGLRPPGLESAAGDAGPPSAGALRPRGGGRNVAGPWPSGPRPSPRKIFDGSTACAGNTGCGCPASPNAWRAVRPAVGNRPALRSCVRPSTKFATAIRRKPCGNWKSTSGDSPRSRPARLRVAQLAGRLEQEMERIQWQAAEEDPESSDPLIRLAQVPLSRAEVEKQVEELLGEATEWMFGDG